MRVSRSIVISDNAETGLENMGLGNMEAMPDIVRSADPRQRFPCLQRLQQKLVWML
ncbi:MAG: hypothetical protein ACLVC1_05190 [Mediterraneibacter gnavus]